MHKYVRVMDPFKNEYTIRLENDRVQDIYHEGWRKYVEIHHVQACLLKQVIDDVVVDHVRAYVTLEGMFVVMPAWRLSTLDPVDVESILTLGELLEKLDDSLYTKAIPVY